MRALLIIRPTNTLYIYIKLILLYFVPFMVLNYVTNILAILFTYYFRC
jgi:hypothetical protein